MRYALPLLVSCAAIAYAPISTRADVKPSPLFGDNAVLLQKAVVPIWGTARDGEKISVSLGDATATTTATNGRWMVELKNLKAGGPYTLTFKGDIEVSSTNVMVGEVWICSGQSNMERQLGPRRGQQPLVNAEAEIASANYPELREFAVGRHPLPAPATETDGKWVVCTPDVAMNFSAVGYYFGRDLHKHLKVPVGMIHTSWGGTPVESWTRKEKLNEVAPEVVAAQERAIANYATALEQYKANEPRLLAEYEEAVKASGSASMTSGTKVPPPRKPGPPANPSTAAGGASNLFNGMVAPIIPYAIRGVIWYQGEANSGGAKLYQTRFPAMIEDWRQLWGRGEFPFLFVQIAPHRSMTPDIREAQFLTQQKVKNTAMAVTVDIGDPLDIHPTRKEPVGGRLALAAQALAYGEKVEYSGPLYDRVEFKNHTAIIHFTHVGSGLVAKDGELKGFEILGADKKVVPAKAVIEGNTVVVSSPEVAEPAAVRYGWQYVPDVNLFNKEGLPASPFRTDTWDDVKPTATPPSANPTPAATPTPSPKP